MIKRIKTLEEAIALGGTMKEASIGPFKAFLSAGFQGNPVEACWNTMKDSYSGGKVKTNVDFHSISYLCLRSFNSNHTNPTDAFMMKITNKSTRPKTAKKFYDYLFSEDSPWAEAFPGLALVGEDKNGIPDAILWHDVAASPSKVVANLLSTMRLHTCWGADWFFDALTKAGFSNEAAVLLSSNFSWGGQSLTLSNGPSGKFAIDPRKTVSLSKLGCSKTDMPFSTNYNPSGFAPLFAKKPGGNKGSLAEGTPVQPNNYIWHTDEVATNADSLSKDSSEYKKAVVKVVKEETPIHEYLLGKVKELSKDFIESIENNLATNKLVTI